MASKYKKVAVDYAKNALSGKIIVGDDVKKACKRFLDDLERKDLELHTQDPDFVIEIIQRHIVHKEGEDLSGNSLMGTPLILLPWQVFIIYNLVGFYLKGTNERRFKEAIINVPRKNGKTLFIAGLAYALSLLNCRSGSRLYIVSGSSEQAYQSFENIKFSLIQRGLRDEWEIHDSQNDHSMQWSMVNENDDVDGSAFIKALASNPDAHDSFKSNIGIVDEAHVVDEAEYSRLKESQKGYTNKLILLISSAGTKTNSFFYRRLEFVDKLLDGTIKDDTIFAFVSRATKKENGDVDFTNPIEHQKANPSYGVTIRPADMEAEALNALHDPQLRSSFLSRSLDVYSHSLKTYFDIEEFKTSNANYKWTLEELSKLPINWYGGADLSKLHDLTASAIYGNYGDVDICITHAFFPVVMAHKKATEDNIPLFGWADDGWLTLCNTPTVNYSDIVNWFISMREMGFKINKIAFDKKFGREFFTEMQKAHFKLEDAPQYYYAKSEGFRHIEKQVKDGKFYYLGSQAYEYCVANVHAIETPADDMIKYQKVETTQRIDLFDASVFACRAMLLQKETDKKLEDWYK